MKLKAFLILFVFCFLWFGSVFADSGNEVVLEGFGKVNSSEIFAQEHERENGETKKRIFKYTTIAVLAAAYAGLKGKKS